MFDTLDFAQDILAREISTTQSVEGLPSSNRQHLTAIIAYQQLVDNWDEDGAIAPTHQTVLAALDIALLLTATGQPIYHTSPGPLGEIMINLRNGDKSAELLTYPNNRIKFVRIGPNEAPQQGPLTPESLRETLQWLNR
ncbi:hypothetical protein WBJ53_22380 [Spirosoma sp. SC4-14]|uniref:hypothetical protein n=1 Tax=Spirosoma sp. SC4-14 TaxID=3128900 RepID=UPI0030D3C2EB